VHTVGQRREKIINTWAGPTFALLVSHRGQWRQVATGLDASDCARFRERATGNGQVEGEDFRLVVEV
jgi:hypothetical protein